MEQIKQRMEDARRQKVNSIFNEATSTVGIDHGQQRAPKLRKMWFISWVTMIIVVVMTTTWVISGQGSGEVRLSDFAPIEEHQISAADSVPVDKLNEKIIRINHRVDMLTESIRSLESKLTQAHVTLDSIFAIEQKLAFLASDEQAEIIDIAHAFESMPPPAAGKMDREATLIQTSQQASTNISTASQKTAMIAVASGPVISSEKDGPWVINLASLHSKRHADRFATKARSRGVETGQQQVTVKGKQYWRVQVTGFSSVEDAKAHADTVKEKLALKDVWITKH